MMKTYAIMSQIGGTGKTLTAYALGRGLVQKGFKVLVVDADYQGVLSEWSGFRPADERVTLKDLLDGHEDLNDALMVTPEGYTLIPSDRYLFQKQESYEKTALREVLKQFESQFDYCIIDAPPSVGHWGTGILMAAQELIIPCYERRNGIFITSILQSMIESVQAEGNPELTVHGILMTQTRPDSATYLQCKEDLQEVAKDLGSRVYDTELRYDEILQEAYRAHKNVFEAYPESDIVQDYAAFVEEFVGRSCFEG